MIALPLKLSHNGVSFRRSAGKYKKIRTKANRAGSAVIVPQVFPGGKYFQQTLERLPWKADQ
jgi:hypothetical protein